MLKQSKEKLLHIATIGKTVGIKGDMKFHIHCDFPEQFYNNSKFLTSKHTNITLSEVSLEKLLIKIKDINTVEDAKIYINTKLFSTQEDTRKNCHLDDGEYFWFDIEDCRVYEDKKLLGIVKDIDRILDINYLNITTSDEMVAKSYSKSFLVPFKKPYVLETNIKDKSIKLIGAMDILEAS